MSSAILDNLDVVATFAAGCFAGTAMYVTTCEVPAMRQLGLDEHWRFFPLMYERAAVSQALFTVIAGVAGVAHGTRIIGSTYHRNLWIISGSAFLAIVPFTLIGLLPTNNTIIGDNKRVKAGGESQFSVAARKELLDKWALLHMVRTITSLAGFGAMVYGISRHTSLVFGW